jgi:hypothetical protein
LLSFICRSHFGCHPHTFGSSSSGCHGSAVAVSSRACCAVLCLALQGSMPPFLTQELVEKCPKRRLTAIGDVSCDPNSTNNPIPLYDAITSWYGQGEQGQCFLPRGRVQCC